MAVIYFIRHGQASFGRKDYDQLSGVGERQARILGHHLQRVAPRLDLFCSGGLARQDHTAELTRDAMGNAAPPLTTDTAFSEYDHEALFRAYLPGFLQREDAGATSLEELLADHRKLERALRHVLSAWMEGRPHDGPPVKSWSHFCDDVVAGVSDLMAGLNPKSRVVVFTSGGVITAVMRSVLGLSHLRTLGLTLSIYNASVTQIYCSRTDNFNGALLLGYNNISHLEMTGDRDLITFR
ncbi:MAG: histidine phosphatase family protein [Gammaproteobacteria bacterium]|jgi:broad specificity phosphatase PhoE|nr:MAG: histidine phosphatase family protein [Gammaproteobacteria bacterium]